MFPLKRLEHYFPAWDWSANDEADDVDQWVAEHQILWLTVVFNGREWAADLRWGSCQGARLMKWDGFDSQESLVRLAADIRGWLHGIGETFIESIALKTDGGS